MYITNILVLFETIVQNDYLCAKIQIKSENERKTVKER